jgi:hypothetical protein
MFARLFSTRKRIFFKLVEIENSSNAKKYKEK